MKTLSQAIQNAKYVLVVMSPDYFINPWKVQELDLALHEEFERERVDVPKVIPLLYRDCEIPLRIRIKVFLDFRTDADFEESFLRLVEVFSEQPANITRRVTEKETVTPLAGSISESVLESTELRLMIDEVRKKVEAFTEKSESPPNSSLASLIEVDPRLCFIVMPFGSEELNDVYEYFVKPAIETQCGLHCERGDDVFGSNAIMEDIRRSIERARLVIADLTGRNPNVFYEVGIAHTLSKEVLLLSQSMSDVPFDLRHRRVLPYDYTPKGCKKLEKSIVDNVNALLKSET